VKTYLNQKDIPSILLDEEELETKEILFDFLKVKNALKKLDGQRLGLIGQVSDWLIASTNLYLQHLLGIFVHLQKAEYNH